MTEEKAIKVLRTKQDLKVDTNKRIIFHLTGVDPKNRRRDDVGIKAWGKIDFLLKHGWSLEKRDQL
jgi:hypothetical protein